MPFTTITEGLTIQVPTRGTRNWDSNLLLNLYTPISAHDHTGAGQGAAITTAALAANSVTGAKIRLDNDEYLRARNNADSADLNLWKANTSDQLEQGTDSAHFNLVNAGYLRGRNNADNAYINLARTTSADEIEIGQASVGYSLLGDLSASITLDADATHEFGDATNKLLRMHAENIRLYGSTSGYVELSSADTVSTSYQIKMPDAEGTINQILKIASVGSNVVNLEFADDLTAGNNEVRAESSNYTVTDSDNARYIFVTTGASNITITLPTAADNTNRALTVKKVDSGSGTVIVDGEGAETIEGASTYVIRYENEFIDTVCTGSAWQIVNRYIPEDELYQVKVLAADVTSNGTVAGLTTTIEVGRTYEAWMNPAFEVDIDNSLVFQAVHNSAVIGVAQCGSEADTDFFRFSRYVPPFTATATTITFEVSSLSGSGVLRGNNDLLETHVIVKEVI